MSKKYYKSSIAGLEVIVGDPDTNKGEVAPQVIRFFPYREKIFGDSVKVGYLETDNEIAQSKLEDDPNVSEIKKDEFDKSTGDGSQPLGY